MDKFKVSEEPHHIGDGIQKLYRFPNGYGASVVRFMVIYSDGTKHSGSYGSEDGLWELAVIKWDGEEFDLVYDTTVTDDVIGGLNDEGVLAVLKEIMELPND